MKNLLLISSSRVHGKTYFEHCRSAIADHFSSAQNILFVPYALKDYDDYESTIASAFEEAGLTIISIHHAPDPVAAGRRGGWDFCGRRKLISTLKNAARNAATDADQTSSAGRFAGLHG